MGKLRFKLAHVVPHVWFYKHKEILDPNESNTDHSEAALVYRRATSVRLLKSGSSTTGQGTSPLSHNAPDQVSGSPRKGSNAKPIKAERFRKGVEIQVCTVVDAGCTCRATMTSPHKEGKGQRHGARSSMVSRLVCKTAEDAVKNQAGEEIATLALDRTDGGDGKEAPEDVLKKNKMYLDVRELEKRLRRVGLKEERKKKLQGSPESLAGVPRPIPLCSVSSTHFAPWDASTSNTSTVGVEDSSIRCSDENSSFSRMSSSVSSCKLSTAELPTEGHASCEGMKSYNMRDEAAGNCLLQRVNSGFSNANPVGEKAISEQLGDLQARRVDNLTVQRSSQHHWSEKSSIEDVDHRSLRKKSSRRKQLVPETPLPISLSPDCERRFLVQEDDNVMQVKQLEGGSSSGCSSDQVKVSFGAGDLDLIQERKELSASGDAKIQLLQQNSSTELCQVTSSISLSAQEYERDDRLQLAHKEEDEGEEEASCGLRRRSRKSVAKLSHQRGKELRKSVEIGQFPSQVQVPKSISAIAELAQRSEAADDHSPSSPEIHDVFNSIAMVKSSYNPQRDFKESMMEMVLTKQLRRSEDLEQLLQCYLSLNAEQYHHIIVEGFQEVCADLFRKTC